VRAIYPSAKTALLRGQMDFEVDTFKAQLTTGAFYDATHVDLDDVTGLIGPAVVLNGIAVANGIATVDDVTFPDVGGGAQIQGVVIFMDGLPAPLVAFINQRRDTVPIDAPATGGDVTLSFDYLVKL
jgi:hypothetical protein